MLQIPFCLNGEEQHILTLLRRYSNVPMSLTDACRVRMSELAEDCAVLTLDSTMA